jgi:hypothetical protein
MLGVGRVFNRVAAVCRRKIVGFVVIIEDLAARCPFLYFA